MNDTSKDETTLKSTRIGLALSGGGFRASIFHLGVIRRLEELGIMKYVYTTSAVSGGSINVRRLDCLVALCCCVSDVRGDATDGQAMGYQGLSDTDR